MEVVPSEAAAEPGAILHEELQRAHRVADGQLAAQDLDWLRKGFRAFLASGGSLPLERCLRLPRRRGALRRAARDYWLRRAWRLMDSELSPWLRSKALAAAVRSFRARQWVRWRCLNLPPCGITELESTLYQAFRSCEHLPMTTMQLHNIAHNRRHC